MHYVAQAHSQKVLAAMQAFMEVDLRDINEPRRDAVLDEILTAAKDIAARRRVRLHTEVVNRDAPATCAAEARSWQGFRVQALHLFCRCMRGLRTATRRPPVRPEARAC